MKIKKIKVRRIIDHVSIYKLANDIESGKYGNGPDRPKLVLKDGYTISGYNKAQDIVNKRELIYKIHQKSYESIPENAISCNKLVRDKIVEKLKDRNATFYSRTIDNDYDYFACLINKFVEEQSELLDIFSQILNVYSSENNQQFFDSICEESVDIITVLFAILDHFDISLESVINRYFQKKYENGNFEGRNYLSWYCK